MSLMLTPEILAGAYDYLLLTPPFRSWNLADTEDVEFVVVNTRLFWGRHTCWTKSDKQRIEVSTRYIRRTDSLIVTMAHEMVHIHQELSGMCRRDRSEHGKGFQRLAAQVCRIHGWDPALF